MSEWINMLIYEQEILNATWVFCGLIGYGSVWRACSARVRIQLHTERFCGGLAPDNQIYIFILSVYKRKEKQKLWWINYYKFYFPSWWKTIYLIFFFTKIFVKNFRNYFRSKNFGEKTIKYFIFRLDGK